MDSYRMVPLVLVENERTAGGLFDHWQDATGERYQYPNQYRKKVLEGRRFVYYKGSRRAGGGKAVPEYFGHGIIGAVHLDPSTDTSEQKNKWKWVCEIGDYWPFQKAVPFKKDGVPYEQIPQNLWSVAVREVTEEAYCSILESAGMQIEPVPASSPSVTAPVRSVSIADKSLLVAHRASPCGPDSDAPSSGGHGPRRSRFSVAIGRKGEQVALQYLREALSEQEARTLRWVSDEGETPGWDIEYKSGEGELVAVEVKATSGGRFPSVELTSNEWSAACRRRGNYRLLLVAAATSSTPRVEILRDPATLVDSGKLRVQPSVWRLIALDEVTERQ